jgi:hypothetical protein
MRTRHLSLLLSSILSLGCGSGTSGPTAATGLDYADPVGTGWRLVKDSSSTSSRLVLNLVGPAGLLTRGVGFNLQAPATVKFGLFPNRLPINDMGVYQLLSNVGDPYEPVALIGGVKPGNLLSVGVFQKGREKAAKDSGAPLCQIALQLDAAARLSAGDQIALVIPKAKSVPQDIGSETDGPRTLSGKVRMTDIAIALGTLSAK